MGCGPLAVLPGVPGHAAGWFMKFTLSPMVRAIADYLPRCREGKMISISTAMVSHGFL
jgi:hypothetical protein